MSRVKHKYNYFYKITNNLNNHFYYGVHSTDNLDDGYMGSGVRLHYAYKKYGIENFSKEILKFFDTREQANQYEAEIVTEELVKDNNCYNVILGGGFDTSGKLTVKDKNGNAFLVSVDDPRYLSGELVSITAGKVAVKDKDGNTFMVDKEDPRYLSGELVSITAGKVAVKDKDGNTFMVNKDDPRYLSGELVPTATGKIVVKDKNGKFYCIDPNDPRYLSGELIKSSVWTGRHHKNDTIDKMKSIFKKNNHQKGNKNSQFGTCWIHNNERNLKIKKEELQEYINNGWIKGRKMKF